MYLTQNSLFPRANAPGGLASAFSQRAALCGGSPAERGAASFDELVQRLAAKPLGLGWSSAASINIVSLGERRMGNVEVHLDRHAVYEVTRGVRGSAANYSHFNMFKTLEVGTADPPEPSTLHRQARVDALPPVRDAAEIGARLSDTADAEYPIYRDMTLHTLILNGTTGVLHVWCCGKRAAVDEPAHQWSLLRFFDEVDEDGGV
jgi:hypothetical protein